MVKLTLERWRAFIKHHRDLVPPHERNVTEVYEAEIKRLSDLLADEILETEYLDDMREEEK